MKVGRISAGRERRLILRPARNNVVRYFGDKERSKNEEGPGKKLGRRASFLRGFRGQKAPWHRELDIPGLLPSKTDVWGQESRSTLDGRMAMGSTHWLAREVMGRDSWAQEAASSLSRGATSLGESAGNTCWMANPRYGVPASRPPSRRSSPQLPPPCPPPDPLPENPWMPCSSSPHPPVRQLRQTPMAIILPRGRMQASPPQALQCSGTQQREQSKADHLFRAVYDGVGTTPSPPSHPRPERSGSGGSIDNIPQLNAQEEREATTKSLFRPTHAQP
ncbi:hypothetical protein BDY21DRAFT_137128 [Lineolata rhizophorae]|uniref:Uncharacterized protein n=1 Tax=Lineolata rhizophorae TaxID=578093 RepID=A0A6A6PAQ9_9PEZI|nr:hypothetical protein BDY21DRAFT_137128 [Lineolata rhizophorae]